MSHKLTFRFLTQFIHYAQKLYLTRILIGLLMVAGLGLAIATYYVFANSQPLGGSSQHTIVLLNLDLAVLLILSLFVANRVMRFRQSQKIGPASRLHTRLIRWFGLMLVTPAIIVTLFSAIFFNLGVESWFSKHVHAALQKSSSVANAYFDEHKKNIASDAIALADFLSKKVLIRDPDTFNAIVNNEAARRSLNETVVFTSHGIVLAQSPLSYTLAMQLDHFSKADLSRAKNHVMIYQNEAQDRVRALIQVDPSLDIFLIIGRYVDPSVLEHVAQTETAVNEFSRLEKRRHAIEVRFILVFIVFSFLLLLFVIWIGMAFANRLARPISSLISAAEQIREGDLKVRVPEKSEEDEFELLSRTFNRMTSELDIQRSKLIEANMQIDRRRHFIETVLSGVSAGVVGLDPKTRITIANRSAATLLGLTHDEIIGRTLAEIVPEIADLLTQKTDATIQSEVQITRDTKTHILHVRIVVEREGDLVIGYIITFDDITLLLNAQRKAAWSDVARKIAHEIKNPLTPIQLAAERLKKKYRDQISQDPETFLRYLDTIGRQVLYIGEMIREFSEFARMPEAVLERQNINEICEEALFLQRNAHPEISFQFNSEKHKNFIYCDPSQTGQILTNLLQNAIDSIQDLQSKNNTFTGKIVVTLNEGEDFYEIFIDDNGKGFPEMNREKLLEPYVTQREKGTGLGLAIVRRIMEAHAGNISLEDSDMGGARVRLVFPKGPVLSDTVHAADSPQLVKTG